VPDRRRRRQTLPTKEDLQPLPSPDPLDALVVHNPAGVAQQGCDFAVAVATILPGKLDDVGCEPLLVVAALRRLALCRAVLAERRTCATLGDAKLTTNMIDAGTATRGLSNFLGQPPAG
jgi:hypothetical protein